MAVNKPALRVVLTRPADRQQVLASYLGSAGCEVLELPALTISPIYPEGQPLQQRQPRQSEPSGQFDRPEHQSKQRLQGLEKKPEQKLEQHLQQQIQQPLQQTANHQSTSDAEVAKWQPSRFDVLVFVSRAAWQNYHRFYLDTSGVDFLRVARFGFNQRSSGSSGVGGADSSGRYQFGSEAQPVAQSEGSKGSEPALFQTPVLACVGVSTARQIADDLDLPLSTITCPQVGLSADSEGLWTLLKPQLSPNAKILIVRGQTGRDWLADTIAQHGATVTCLSVYRREPVTWSQEQLTTLKSWAIDTTYANSASDAAQGEQNGTGTWLITSGEGLAAIEQQYQLHGLTGKPGFAPQKVVVVHERLKAPVCRWLAHWHTGAKSREKIPVMVVTPDDEAMAQGILSEGQS